jgi:hypothetical protein
VCGNSGLRPAFPEHDVDNPGYAETEFWRIFGKCVRDVDETAQPEKYGKRGSA